MLVNIDATLPHTDIKQLNAQLRAKTRQLRAAWHCLFTLLTDPAETSQGQRLRMAVYLQYAWLRFKLKEHHYQAAN